MDVRALRSQHFGRVLVPGDDGYRAACAGWNLVARHRPAVIAIPETATDVAVAVFAAAQVGMPIAVQATGHGPSGDTDGGLLINTRMLTGLDVYAEARVARVGAGVHMRALINAAATAQLTPLSGSAMNISVVGYLTGGGLPVLGRTYGFAADHVHSVEVVTADGQLRYVNADRYPDLFWGVRGGKSNFGIVTNAELDLLPLRQFVGGALIFPGTSTADLLPRWIAWCSEQSDQMCSSMALMRVPDAAGFPAPLRGEFLIFIRIACTADPADTETMIKPLRSLGPMSDTVGEMTADQIGAVHNDPTEPLAALDGGVLLGELDSTAIDRMIQHAGPDALDPVTLFEIRRMGGALGRPPAIPNAIGRRNAQWAVNLPTVVADGQLSRAHEQQKAVFDALRPWGIGGLPNLLGPNATAERVQSAYTDADYARLRQLKRTWDPHNLFRSNHNIPPAQDIS